MKVPTKHGLDRKFKPWRKGKSAKSNKRSSLKQQLRGHERLLAKLGQGGGSNNNNNNNNASVEDEAQKRKELEAKIDTLRQEIGAKQQQIQCKKHAEKAHGPRFMDRQKLTRLEKQVRKKNDDDGETNTNNEDTKEQLLFKLALDQVYVAHHPTDVKYMPLFKFGQRITDQSRQLYRRAVTRKRILKGLSSAITATNGDPNPQSFDGRVSWISQDQYDRLPTDWTIQDEERVFGGSVSRKHVKDAEKDSATAATAQDARFAMPPTTHEALLQAADELEAETDQEEKKVGDKVGVGKGVGKYDADSKSSSSSSGSSRSDNDDEASGDENDGQDADPMVRQHPNPSKKQTGDDNKDDSDSSSDSNDSDSSSDGDSDNDKDDDRVDEAQSSKTTSQNEKRPTSGADGDDDDNDDDDDDEVDDFLMDAAANEDINNVFEKTTSEIPAWGEARGDISRGWETQRQRPGEFKRKRVRY